MSAIPVYPVRVEGKLDPHLSRWLWLVKWLLAIPHYVVLAFLWVAFAVMTVFAFFAIVFTGRYPRAVFDFNLGVLRWTWRVAYYSTSALATDRYPPFTLAAVPEYPATLDVPYPEHLSRGLALVKWWLLAVPHYLVVGFFVGGASALAWTWPAGIGLIGLLVVFAAVVLLFTGRYPRGIFDLVLGLDRWALRVAAYAGLMTDAYPPFRLDLGGSDPSSVAVTESPSAPTPRRDWSGGRIVGLTAAIAGTLVALALAGGGGMLLVLDTTERDDAGYLMTPAHYFSTPAYAIVSDTADIAIDGPDEVAAQFLGTVRIRSESDRPVFVGIARAQDVDAYLEGVRRAVVTQIGADGDYTTGHSPPSTPAPAQQFWAASTVGAGEQFLTWEPEDGNWKVVVMNADASPSVAADLSIGAELDPIVWVGLGIGLAGLLLLVGGAFGIYAAIPKGEEQ